MVQELKKKAKWKWCLESKKCRELREGVVNSVSAVATNEKEVSKDWTERGKNVEVTCQFTFQQCEGGSKNIVWYFEEKLHCMRGIVSFFLSLLG